MREMSSEIRSIWGLRVLRLLARPARPVALRLGRVHQLQPRAR
jgi:hypothetical protein